MTMGSGSFEKSAAPLLVPGSGLTGCPSGPQMAGAERKEMGIPGEGQPSPAWPPRIQETLLPIIVLSDGEGPPLPEWATVLR